MADDVPAEVDRTTRLRALLADEQRGVVITLKRDGRPQSSNVIYALDGDQLLISVTDGRAKTANLRRDPRVSVHVSSSDFWSYVVVEGTATLSPVASAPDDATVDALVALYRRLAGEHDDWDEYRAAMVAERRLVLTVDIERLYGAPPG